MQSDDSTPRHIDSTAALRALVASVPGLPSDALTWAAPLDPLGGHYCEACQADFPDCPRTVGEHPATCPPLCANCQPEEDIPSIVWEDEL